jgi:hypothetical protein
MLRILSLGLLITMIFNSSAGEVELRSTNQDNRGKFLPLLEKSGLGYLASPTNSFLEFSTKVVRMKGAKFHVIIAGALSAKVSDRGEPGTVELDAYQDGEFLETRKIKGHYIALRIMLKDHDTISLDDVFREGYFNVALPYIRSTTSGARTISIYRGKFKLLYEFTEAELQAHLGTLDSPKLLVEIVVSERIGRETESSDPINLNEKNKFDTVESETDLKRAFDEFGN